jgi:hypothetical protein
MNQSRLGGDPLEKTLIRDTRGDKPEAGPKPSRPAAGKPGQGGAEKKIRAAMKEGRGKNYYLRGRKEKELTQKVLIYLPFDMVRRLKKEAIDEGVSLSALIQGRLSG